MRFLLQAFFVCCALTFSGCFIHTRDVITADVKYEGDYRVKTRYRYRVMSLRSFFKPFLRTQFNTHGALDGEVPPSVVLRSQTLSCGDHELADKDALARLQSDFERALPNVFSQDGIPFELVEGPTEDAWDFCGTYAFHVFSLGLIPGAHDDDKKRTYSVVFTDLCEKLESAVLVHNRESIIQSSFLPLAAFFSFDPIEESGHITFCQTNWNASVDDERMQKRKQHRILAVAYGIAVKLKELEDSGKIDVAKVKLKVPMGLRGGGDHGNVVTLPDAQPFGEVVRRAAEPAIATPQHGQSVLRQSSAYKILSFDRESGSEFAYRFVLALLDENNSSLHTLRSVQQEFRLAVKSDYAESFPGVDASSLYVDFPEYKLTDGKINGRAVVLSISVTSLTYDPNTRMGKLAVKVNANQYEEARKWIRKNIETLARDKNIALTTGEIPPAAKFYLGREVLKNGNILEIEFKTE